MENLENKFPNVFTNPDDAMMRFKQVANICSREFANNKIIYFKIKLVTINIRILINILFNADDNSHRLSEKKRRKIRKH